MTFAKSCPVLIGAASIGLACVATSCKTYQTLFTAAGSIDAKAEVPQPGTKRWPSWFGKEESSPVVDEMVSNSYAGPSPEKDAPVKQVANTGIKPAEPNVSVAAVEKSAQQELPALKPVSIVSSSLPKPKAMEKPKTIPSFSVAANNRKPAPKPKPKAVVKPVSNPPVVVAKSLPIPVPGTPLRDRAPEQVDQVMIALSNEPSEEKSPDTIKLAKKPGDQPKPLEINANGVVRIIDAKGEDIVISGRDGVVIIKGRCGVLTVTGQKNRVTCDRSEKVAITGSENTLVSKIINEGYISGSRNELSWRESATGKVPNLISTGSYNHINRIK